MPKKSGKSFLQTINEKTKKAKNSRFSVPIYVLTSFLASVWLIFVNPCLMNILLPVIAILVTYKFYDEESFKKLIVAGLIVCILISLTTAVYQTGILYGRPSRDLSSQNNLYNGTVNPIYGDTNTEFNLTVEVDENFIENHDQENFTLYANFSSPTIEGIRQSEFKGYNMSKINGTNEYYAVVSDLPKRLFNHFFTLRINITEEMGNMTEDSAYSWETTSLGFGPVTIKRSTALWQITLQRGIATTIVLLLGIGLLWVKKRMDTSVEESTEGLEKKEEELEDYCPECGHLLKGKDECDRCGWVRDIADEKYKENGEKD